MIEDKFQIKYDVEDGIELHNLIDSLKGFDSAIESIKDYYNSDVNLRINVEAVEKGSIYLYIALLVAENLNTISTLFTRENVSFTSSIISSLSNSINISKHLRGGKPKSIETKDDQMQVYIENQNGEVKIVHVNELNIYSESGVTEALKGAFDVANRESKIKKIAVLDENNKELAVVDRNELVDISSPLPAPSPDDEQTRSITERNVAINITKLSFEKNIKWSFILNGYKINAKVSDEDFYSSIIDKGEKFAKGDALRVDLRIEQEFDLGSNVFVNKQYEVVRVIKHLPRGTQSKLDFQ